MNGKVVIVTGGGRGIGRAICQRFAEAGATVVAAARSQEDLDETLRLIESAGGFCGVLKTDVTRVDEVDALVSSTVDRLGKVDVLVNNAGLAPNGPIDSFDPSLFDQMIAVNVNAVFYGCRAVWPIMRERGGGVIVNISSVAAIDPFPGFAAYAGSKSFVNGLTNALAKEGAEHGIRVYGVGPGAVDTEMLRGPFPDFPDDQCLQPSDIAESVWFMTQPACRYSAGQTLYVSKT